LRNGRRRTPEGNGSTRGQGKPTFQLDIKKWSQNKKKEAVLSEKKRRKSRTKTKKGLRPVRREKENEKGCIPPEKEGIDEKNSKK